MWGVYSGTAKRVAESTTVSSGRILTYRVLSPTQPQRLAVANRGGYQLPQSESTTPDARAPEAHPPDSCHFPPKQPAGTTQCRTTQLLALDRNGQGSCSLLDRNTQLD